ncbi:MAG TPA: hypothetical protein VHS96_02005 [Bacteroidia bacterium]|nr:hypothetical protein [Bacteroidia bacterium]
MKNTLYFLILATALAACTPPASTDAGNTDVADSAAVTVNEPQDSLPDDTTVVADAGTPDPKVSNDAGTASGSDAGNTGGGRQANPNGNLGAKTFKVSGNVLVTGSYCGGAAPSEEILAEASRPKPFANKGFLIRSGKMNALGTDMVTRTRTDAQGTFSVELIPGTYCMVLETKERARDAGFYKLQNLAVDKPCDQKWLNTCDLTFTVADKNITGLRLNFNKKCFVDDLSPCVSFTGPMPPSAAPKGR